MSALRTSDVRHPGSLLRRALAVLLWASLALFVCACGSSSSSSSTQSSSKTTTTASTASSTGSATINGVTITANPALHAMLPASIKSSGQIDVGEDPTEPPWGYYSPAGSTNWTGAEYVLGKAIGAELGVHWNVSEQLFTGLIPAILAGKYQVGLANLGDEKTREATLAFVDYLYDGDGLLVTKGNPHHISSLASFCGLPMAITAGSTFLSYVQSQSKPLCGSKPYTIQTYPDDADTFLAVKAGKAVGTLTDVAEAAYVARTSGGGAVYQAVRTPGHPQGYDVAWIGMAVTKSQPQLANAILAAEQALVTSGAEKKLLDAFGLGFFAGTTPQINACALPKYASAC